MIDRNRQRGFALLIVLWTLALLALIITHITATGRTEARIASNLTSNAEAEAAADGAVFETIFRLIDGSNRHWIADGSLRRLSVAGSDITIRIADESGKINPNSASADLWLALLRAVQVPGDRAQALSQAILDWREPGDIARPQGGKMAQYASVGLDHGPPGAPFERVGELRRVMGMTPEILAALSPHLSIFQHDPPDLAAADPIVRNVLQATLPAGPGAAPNARIPGVQLVAVSASAVTRQNGRFTRNAILRISPNLPRGYAILTWSAEP